MWIFPFNLQECNLPLQKLDLTLSYVQNCWKELIIAVALANNYKNHATMISKPHSNENTINLIIIETKRQNQKSEARGLWWSDGLGDDTCWDWRGRTWCIKTSRGD